MEKNQEGYYKLLIKNILLKYIVVYIMGACKNSPSIYYIFVCSLFELEYSSSFFYVTVMEQENC